MTAPKNIPEEFKYAHRRLMGLLPEKLRKDPKIQNTTLLFLKFGGVALARHSVEIQIVRFKEEMKRIKKHLREEARLREEALKKAAKSLDPDHQAPDGPDAKAQNVPAAKTNAEGSS